MPDNQLLNTEGFTTAPTTIGNVVGTSGFTGFTGNTIQRTAVRVTGFGPNGNLYYEFVKNNYGKSDMGTPNLKQVAIPSSPTIVNMPSEPGEYIEIFSGPDANAASQNKADGIPTVYWDSVKGPLNIWNELTGSQKNLDPTVPNQVQDNKMTNLNPINYTNSLNGFT